MVPERQRTFQRASLDGESPDPALIITNDLTILSIILKFKRSHGNGFAVHNLVGVDNQFSRFVTLGNVPKTTSSELLGSIANKVMQRARLANVFSELYPIVRKYVANRCFGQVVDVDDEKIRSHLHRLDLREGIAKYLARKISELTVEKATLQFENADFQLSDTKPFSWRRNLPPLVAKHTVFNYVATYNAFEREFAEFLDDAKDVLRFASLGTTEQGESGTEFRVDYLKPKLLGDLCPKS